MHCLYRCEDTGKGNAVKRQDRYSYLLIDT
uniref:Uncharacterized protein n=1 Tax=Moniliophthora roreri TaxID=221103 RepID=A0A0W0FBE1_MONRR